MMTRRVQWLILVVPCLLGRAEAGPAGAKLEVDAEARKQMVLCGDGKNHYVVIAQDKQTIHKLYYGDGKRFYLVPSPTMIGGEWFPDPRNFNKQYNSDFRGVDLRYYSRVEMKDEKTCEVACGERSAKIPVIDGKKAQSILAGASFEQTPRKYEPYALARDNAGIYYYVDRGFSPEKQKSFRLFVGPKGDMKLQKMTNIVSDSEGDIFATKTGSLRLVLNRQEYQWIEGDKPKKLTWVPWQDNQAMIFNDMGVYIGERLGTPCDDF